MKKLVIFDSEKQEVHIYSVDKNILGSNSASMVEKFGHNVEACRWVLLEDDSKIINH